MTAVIDFAGVGHTYPGPPPVRALSPTTLSIQAGELVAVVGPSGSGKSTFLNLVGLLDRVRIGRYLLAGIDVAGLSEAERTVLRGRRIGFVFQSFHLLPYRSAVENVALALLYTERDRRARRRRAFEMLERVGLVHRAAAPAMALSGGERQRVAIARALAGRPSLVLCDEPTGNLDSANAGIVLRLLQELNAGGLTVLVVTHDEQVAGTASRTLLIRDGVVGERG